jgi:2'-phosphotransferase
MAAAVLQPLQGLSLDSGIMDPSPISPNASRHGRSKHGGSVAKSNKRGRGYSVVDDREAMISKALTWALKRTVDENDEQEEGEEKLVADAEGWVDCEDVVSGYHSGFYSEDQAIGSPALILTSSHDQISRPSKSL